MADSLAYRGPDDHGLWSDPEAGIALTHRRLSIVDLSPAGHQPMVSADGRFIITYNGEIYNFQEMRPELEARGIKFRGHSDTEVMLEAFAAFGIEATVKRLIGMFTIGVWDRRERTLTLVRDRLGIKPLYWAKFGKLFLFGSELKALRAHPGWTPRIDRGRRRLHAAQLHSGSAHDLRRRPQARARNHLTLPPDGEPQIERFWDARAIAQAGLADPLQVNDNELTDRLEELLRDAVGRRMVADVPVGAFLSGGVDSSTVVALMKAANAGPVRTYTIGFDLPGFDEAAHSAAVARHLGTDHTELTVTAKEALDVIPQLPDMYDEPFADSSQIPTHLVSAMTRRHVTVALSGDGGDELFGGYNRYQLATGRLAIAVPAATSAAAGNCSNVDRRAGRSLVTNAFGHSLPACGPGKSATNCTSLRQFFAPTMIPHLYRRLVTHWEPAQIVPGAAEPKGFSGMPSSSGIFRACSNACSFSILSPICPTTFSPKLTAPAWRWLWKPGSRCWITGWWNLPGESPAKR